MRTAALDHHSIWVSTLFPGHVEPYLIVYILDLVTADQVTFATTILFGLITLPLSVPLQYNQPNVTFDPVSIQLQHSNYRYSHLRPS